LVAASKRNSERRPTARSGSGWVVNGRACASRAPYKVSGDVFPVNNAELIAIVDDDPSLLRALHRLIQSNGYSVESFASARDFLDALTRCRPACLVLDVHLNGSGFELQERLAADGMKIPIIFITAAQDDASTRCRVEKSGAAAHLWKPVDGQALLHAIRRAIGQDANPEGEERPSRLRAG
jgi:FixJ family two-component response regulator